MSHAKQLRAFKSGCVVVAENSVAEEKNRDLTDVRIVVDILIIFRWGVNESAVLIHVQLEIHSVAIWGHTIDRQEVGRF